MIVQTELPTSGTMDTRALGASGIVVSALGVGAWAWGDRGYWGYGKSYTIEDIKQAYKVSVDAGITLFDTAEIYGRGRSERLLGRCIRWDGRPVVVASKFAPLPYRLSPRSLLKALDASLERLGMDHIDLYQVHWPYTLLSIDDLMEMMAQALKSGKIRAVGVSNYSAGQMLQAQRVLARHGVPLASNQVQYSLLHRAPEVNHVLDTCRRLNVALIAYSPLAQGVLTGKYTGEDAGAVPLRRWRSGLMRQAQRPQTRQLVATLKQIAEARGKTPGQVAINWLICKDTLVIPIPGAKTANQARQNAGALGWRLETEEVRRLDEASLHWRR
ncbi:MAG TPA: aldo/keto reductase [Chloroflexota bacterium]|jgi:aryl-alcohol dehydrogenase-like predicted oxidoreductase|nr:aldo/keto reductase [Chloroflexota bacterium]